SNNNSKTHFRDYNDTSPFEILDFTEDIDALKIFMEKLRATGGGDQCSDVIGGLEKCAELRWASKIKVLGGKKWLQKRKFQQERGIKKKKGDAPPHNFMYHDGIGDKYPNDKRRDHNVVLRVLQKKENMRYYIAKLNSSLNKVLYEKKKRERER
ncbi:hypothetical protein RFI_08455, partial [Reticulomyxa filosa]